MISLISLALLAPTMHQATPPSTPLPVIEKTIQSASLIYEDMPAGFYKIEYKVTSSDPNAPKRKQKVYIRKDLYEYSSLRIHEVFGIAYDSPTAPTDAFLLEVMSKRYSAGGIQYELPSSTQKNYRFRYKVDLQQSVTAAQLKEYLEVVAATSDSLEKELNPGKEDIQ